MSSVHRIGKNDLVSQVASMEQFRLARGLAVVGWISEIDGGMCLRRKKFGGIATLVIPRKDRLVRFGFEYLQRVVTGSLSLCRRRASGADIRSCRG